MQPNRGVIGNIAQKPFAFLLTFGVLFAMTVWFLGVVDALPETSPREGAVSSGGTVVPTQAENPIRVVASAIGMDVTIENPASTDIAVLDDSLLRGAVRWPTSAPLGVDGTVLLFGHSSSLPVIYNQAFKAFNNIQNLKTGETISVYSGTTEYRYAVTGVRKADAEEDVVELPSDKKYLTLVTCDSFGRKTSRFVVTADFVGAFALAN